MPARVLTFNSYVARVLTNALVRIRYELKIRIVLILRHKKKKSVQRILYISEKKQKPKQTALRKNHTEIPS